LIKSLHWILTGALLASGSAQAFPDRPITLVVPFGAGTAVDVNARDFVQALTPVVKQPVVIDNRAGAEGTIGGVAVLRAQPDGYTLMFTSSSIPVLDPVTKKNRQFDALKDFAPICTVALTDNVINIGGSNRLKTATEVIAAAKANPGKLTYAYSTATTRLAAELFAQAAGIKLTGVSYKASGAGLTDVAGGVVDLFFIDHVSAAPLYQSGKLRPIAVAGDKRLQSLPDVPSGAEIGVPAFDIQPWFGVYAPAKTPAAVVKQLRETVVQALKAPTAIAAMDKRGVKPFVVCGEEMDKLQRDQIELWRKVTTQAGIEPE
jgi:tripartite-type tricarboxylate transporter receptor subunit TctC